MQKSSDLWPQDNASSLCASILKNTVAVRFQVQARGGCFPDVAAAYFSHAPKGRV